MEQPKRSINGQFNLNTVLLSGCLALSGWVLFSINQLDEKIAGMMPLINANSSAISSINEVDKEHSEKLEQLSIRLTQLETIQASQSKNKN